MPPGPEANREPFRKQLTSRAGLHPEGQHWRGQSWEQVRTRCRAEKGACLGRRRQQHLLRVIVLPLVGSGQAGGCAGVTFSGSQCRSPEQ